ncbi:MAG: methyltransferase domain-containing protein [Planctomycetales bacterium]
MWDPQVYARYSGERSRPFFDLLSQITLENPRSIVDLGCGPGHLTRTLCDRWPEAQVLGIDSSPEMLADAQPQSLPGRLQFQQGEIETWHTDEKLDLIVSNAALHWVPDHPRLLSRLSAMLTDHGVLAVQMPNRFRSTSQKVIDQSASDPRWKQFLEGVGLHGESVLPMKEYVACLQDLDLRVNAWETTYGHILTGADPVLEWVRGTALRPLLHALPEELHAAFLKDLAERFKIEFPPRNGTTLFPFPRLFFVATR